MQIQSKTTVTRVTFVVICFKFSNFAYANTVKGCCKQLTWRLLFALNLVTLLMQIQWKRAKRRYYYGCYLL